MWRIRERPGDKAVLYACRRRPAKEGPINRLELINSPARRTLSAMPPPRCVLPLMLYYLYRPIWNWLYSSRCFSTQLSPPSFTFLIVFFLFLIICCVWKIFNRFFSFEIYLKPVPIFYAFNYSSIQSTDNQGLLPVSSILYSSLFLQLCCNLINAS